MKKIIPFLWISLLAGTVASQTFSTDWSSIPVKFVGNNAKQISDYLLSSPRLKDKDEFETTSDFESRISDAKKIQIGPRLSADSILVFRLDPGLSPTSSDVSVRYDADAEKFDVSIGVSSLKQYAPRDHSKFAVAGKNYGGVVIAPQTYEYLGSYIGENAFGVRREIKKSRLNFYKLAITNLEMFGYQSQYQYIFEPIKVAFPLQRSKARFVKENIEILYVTKLSSPFFGIDFVKIGAKVDSPSEIEGYTYFLIGELEEVWVFNGRTGEIYVRIRPQEQINRVATVAEPSKTAATDALIQPARTISGGVLNGKATSFPKPTYPPAARAVRASGQVVVQVVISETGSVISASATSGHPLLRQAAVAAARAAMFSPATLNGTPVKVSGIVTYNFVP